MASGQAGFREKLAGIGIDGGQRHRSFRCAENHKEKAGGAWLHAGHPPSVRRYVRGKTECCASIRDRPLSRGDIVRVNHGICYES
jgi:hypothetical protein